MRLRRRAATVLVACVAIAAIGACGIPKDSEPRLIAEEPDGFATSTQTTDEAGAGTVLVYLIDGEVDPPKLAESERSTTLAPGPLTAVDRLLAGTTEEEVIDGLQTRIPQDTRLLDGSGVAEGLITLNLSREFLTITGPIAVQAYAQLVYTATQYDANQVRFLIDSEPVDAFTDGESKEIVDRRDYSSLDPNS